MGSMQQLGKGHLLEGGGWAGANGVRVIPFVHLKMGGLHEIVQPFLRGHVFLCFPISVPQKRNNTEGISSKSNIIHNQNDGLINQHNMVYSSPFTLEK